MPSRKKGCGAGVVRLVLATSNNSCFLIALFAAATSRTPKLPSSSLNVLYSPLLFLYGLSLELWRAH